MGQATTYTSSKSWLPMASMEHDKGMRNIRIGVVNVMPEADKYYIQLIKVLPHRFFNISTVWIRLNSHQYRSTDKDIVKNNSVSFEEALDSNLDCIIVTGAPVEHLKFSQISYWAELKDILNYANNHITSTVGLCWGGLAISEILGITKIDFEEKLHGVYETTLLGYESNLLRNSDDSFLCPQSRWAGLSSHSMSEHVKSEDIIPVANIGTGETVIYKTENDRFVAHLGHPEYNPSTLVLEYERDSTNSPRQKPINVDLLNPINKWRLHRENFFSSWMETVCEKKQVAMGISQFRTS